MLKAKDIMNKRFYTVLENAEVNKICGILIKGKVSGVPVINNRKKLVGFVSERDIILTTCYLGFNKKKAKDVMTKKVASVKENTPVDRVSKIFSGKPFRYIPVTKNGAVVGVISRKQVINRLLGQYY